MSPWSWLQRQPLSAQLLLVLVLLGLGARVALAATTVGSTDVTIWRYHAQHIRHHGLFRTYVEDRGPPSPYPVFNHPPLPSLYAAWADKVAGGSLLRFSELLKLPGLLAELLALWLVARINARRANARAGLRAAAAYALSLCSILMSGYHGNTDCVYAALCLGSVYLLADRDAPFLSGLALAAALNVKLIPLLILVPIALFLPDRRHLARFGAGLALGLVPFLFPLVAVPREFARDAFAYSSQLELWGLAILAARHPFSGVPGGFASWFGWYVAHYRPFLGAAVLGWCGLCRFVLRRSLYEAALGALLVFLVLTPGFGLQYLAAILPLAFAVDVFWASVISGLAGLFAGTAYYAFWTGDWPAFSQFTFPFPFPAPLFGVLTWAAAIMLLVLMVRVDLPGRRSPAPLVRPP